MAQSSAYKSYERGTRQLLSESGFSSGIMYTDKPLDEEYVKLLVNFDYKDEGASLVPRGGYNILSEHPVEGMTTQHHLLTSSKCVVDCVSVGVPPEQRTVCLLQGKPEAAPILHNQRYILRYPSSQLYVVMGDEAVVSTACKTLPTSTTDAEVEDVPEYFLVGECFNPNKKPVVHAMEVTAAGPNKIIHTWFNGKLYAPMLDNDGVMHYGKLEIVKKGEAFFHRFSEVTPTDTSVSEALSSGYNMLKENPYAFTNRQGPAYLIDGITPFDKPNTEADRKVILSAKLGTTIYFDMIYQYPAGGKFTVRWEMWDLDASSDWVMLQTEKTAKDTNNPGAIVSTIKTGGDPITLAYTPSTEKFQIRCSIYEVSGTTVATTATKILILPVYNLASTTSDSKNAEAKTYDLMSCIGMMPWRRRVLMWGAANAENVIWMSDTNDPAYMPYPHNATIFDEDVIHVTTFQDNVLVFTASKIYQMTLNEAGTGFVKSLVQDRLSISEEDKYVVQVIKNMIFFKSDNYYYMIVPKMNSIRQEQTIAPVSRPVLYLLDNFESAIREALDTLYFGAIYASYTLALVRSFNYVDNTVVRNVYTLRCTSTEVNAQPTDTFTFSFVLNYDTIQRTWTSYCYQNNVLLVPFKQTITDATTFVSCKANRFVYIKSDPLNNEDNIHVDTVLLKNYQLLDTGYREHNSQYKKRYRELQMKINNVAKTKLDFYSEFIVDDDVRKTYQRYVTKHITDPNSSDYGLFFVDRIPETTWTLPGSTILADAEAPDPNLWTLDFSKFPEITSAKVRMPVSGKGYAGRFKFISYNEKPFELLALNWVFRVLYAR